VPIYKGKIQTVPEVMYKDFSDPPLPYLNSAFAKFPEPLVVNRPIIVYEFTQFEPATITDEQIGDRNDTINSVDHRGFDAQTLHLSIPEFERGFFFGFPAVRIQYRVAYKKNKWLNRPIDAGYEFYTTDGTVWSKEKSDTLCLLNPNGTKRPEREDPLYLEFKQFLEIPFSFLR